MDKRMMAAIAVAIGASLFGFLGVCNRYFYEEGGLNSLDTVMIRFSVSALFLLIVIGIIARKQLRIKKKDIPILVVFGFFKLMADIFFIYSQNNISLCLSTLLQMTAPYYVMFISYILFKEKITMNKLGALGVGTIGCLFVTGVLFGNVSARAEGVLAALLSGLFYGLFMIGNKVTLDRRIAPAASLFYTLLFADIMTLPFFNAEGVADALSDPEGMAMALFFGVFLTVIPFFIFTWSMKYLEPTITSAITVLELVAATIVGYLVFEEELTPLKIAGIVLVIVSILLINMKISKDLRKKYGDRLSPVAMLGLLKLTKKDERRNAK
jgi:drug/metabolite transporter (DMT)-like permease